MMEDLFAASGPFWTVFIMIFMIITLYSHRTWPLVTALGGSMGLVLFLFGVSPVIQLVVVAATILIHSVIYMVIHRHIARDRVRKEHELVGRQVYLASDTNPLQKGRMTVDGKSYSCIAKNESIFAGTLVKIIGMEGKDFIVQSIDKKERYSWEFIIDEIESKSPAR